MIYDYISLHIITYYYLSLYIYIYIIIYHRISFYIIIYHNTYILHSIFGYLWWGNPMVSVEDVP